MGKQGANITQESWPSVTIVVLNWNGRALLERCLPPLLQQEYPKYDVILVDNASQDDSVAYTQTRFPQIQIVQNEENWGFAKGNNSGIQKATGDVVVLLNTDVIVQPSWLTTLIQPMIDDSKIGVTGCLLLFPDGHTIQHAGGFLEYPLAYSGHYHYKETDTGQITGIRDVTYVTAAVFAIRRETLTVVGLLDEGFSPFYFEEVDYCYRAKEAGFRIVLAADAVAIHLESASMKKVSALQKRAFHQNRLRFVLKHYSAPQFLDDFVPAEMARLAEPATAQDYHLIGQIYLETAVSAPDLLQNRWDDNDILLAQAALLQLRQTALTQEPAVHKLKEEGWPQAELISRQNLTELQFTSDTAVIGPLIAGFRRHWNNVAARWSVGHVIQQQNNYNRLVSRVLDELDSRSQTNAADIGLLLAELLQMRQIQTRFIQETQKELAQLRKKLEQIEQMLTK